MTGRALLLGCPDPGLVGVHADLAAMTDLLGHHGFTDISALLRGDRAAILAALDALVARTAPGDAVVLYYSGHGWRVLLSQDRGGPRDFQGIAPADLHATTESDFRGILADELSARVDRLTEKTANVTTIFDCCHATDVTRGPGDATGARTLPVPWTIPADQLFARLQALGLARPRLDPEINPSAVQLFACRPDEEAGEDPYAPGGLLTRALVATLSDPDAAGLTWEEVVHRIDDRVQRVRPNQHPAVAGPARRRVFSLETRTLDGATACFTRAATLWLVGGALTDIRAGDRFEALAPANAGVKVEAVHHQLARVHADRPIPESATVRPVAWATPRAAVDIAADLPRHAAVLAALTESGLLTCTPSPDVPSIATLAASRTGLEIRRPDGAVVAADLGIDAARAWLVRMARAEVLGRLTTAAPLLPEDHAFDLEWSRAEPRQPLSEGATLPREASLTARVHNRGRLPLYVTLFAAEVTGRITLLTRSQPAGVELLPGRTYNLGEDRYHGIRGLPLPGPPPPGPVTLVAFVLSAGIPLGAWETRLDEDGRTTAPPIADTFPAHPATYAVVRLTIQIVP